MDISIAISLLGEGAREALRAAAASMEDANSAVVRQSMCNQAEKHEARAEEAEIRLVTRRRDVANIDEALAGLAGAGCTEAVIVSEVLAARKAELVRLMEREDGTKSRAEAKMLRESLDGLDRRAKIGAAIRAALART